MSETVTAPATEAVAADAAPVAAAAPAEPQAPLLAGDPPAEAAPAEIKTEAAPETLDYVIELPEGAAVDETRLASYKGALKDAGLTQDQATKLTPFLLTQMQAIQQEQLNAWADTTKAWRSAVEADPEIGGTNLRASLVNAALARDTYGSPEFKALLADPHLGIGNHPAVVRFLAAVGKAAGEDQRGIERNAGTAGDLTNKSAEAVGARVFSKTWT